MHDWVGIKTMIGLACSMMGLRKSKKAGAVLDKHVNYHQLRTHPLKKDQLTELQRHILSNLTNSLGNATGIV